MRRHKDRLSIPRSFPLKGWHYSSLINRPPHTCRTKRPSISVIFGSPTPPFRSGAGLSSSALAACHRSMGLVSHHDHDRRRLGSCVGDTRCEAQPVAPPFTNLLWLGIRPEIRGFAGFRQFNQKPHCQTTSQRRCARLRTLSFS